MDISTKIKVLYRIAKEIAHNERYNKQKETDNYFKASIKIKNEILNELEAEVTKEKFNQIENELRGIKNRYKK